MYVLVTGVVSGVTLTINVGSAGTDATSASSGTVSGGSNGGGGGNKAHLDFVLLYCSSKFVSAFSFAHIYPSYFTSNKSMLLQDTTTAEAAEGQQIFGSAAPL
jgi:hypothetical protein